MTAAVAAARFLIYSTIGIVAFFVPFTFNGRSTIVMDHIVSFVIADLFGFAQLVCVAFMTMGVIVPFTNGSWRKVQDSDSHLDLPGQRNPADSHVSV